MGYDIFYIMGFKLIATKTIQPSEEFINDYGKSGAYWTSLNKPVKVKALELVNVVLYLNLLFI